MSHIFGRMRGSHTWGMLCSLGFLYSLTGCTQTLPRNCQPIQNQTSCAAPQYLASNISPSGWYCCKFYKFTSPLSSFSAPLVVLFNFYQDFPSSLIVSTDWLHFTHLYKSHCILSVGSMILFSESNHPLMFLMWNGFTTICHVSFHECVNLCLYPVPQHCLRGGQPRHQSQHLLMMFHREVPGKVTRMTSCLERLTSMKIQLLG